MLTDHFTGAWNTYHAFTYELEQIIANAVGVSVYGAHQTDGAVFNREIPIDENTAIYWYIPTVKPI